MKVISTTTFLVAALVTATTARAQSDFKHAVSRSSFCNSMGRMARSVYTARLNGEPKAKYMDQMMAADLGSRASEMARFAIDYGYDQAIDHKDAHIEGLAKLHGQH